MNIIKKFLNVLALLVLVQTCAAMAPNNDRRKFPQLTPQEITELKNSGMNDEMIGSLQEMTQWFDNVIDGWSPEEQNKFWSEFDELNNTLNQMSPEERDKYTQEMLSKAFADLGVQEQPATQPVPLPEPVAKPVEVKKPTPVKVNDTEQDKLFKMLTQLSNSIQSFLNKVQASPDFGIKVEGWARKNEIPQWTPSLKWEKLKADLELFDATIQQVKLRDKAGKYRFIDELLKNKALVDNISRTQAVLAQYEPQIDIASFGVISLNKSTKTGIQKVVNALSEALYTLNVRDGLLKVIEQFEPEAKKLREQQAAQEKQAAQQCAVRPQQNRPTTLAGYPDQGYPLGTTPDYPSMRQRPAEQGAVQTGQFKGPQSSETKKEQPAGKGDGAPKKKEKKALVPDKGAEDLYKNLSGEVMSVVRMIETSKLRSLGEHLTKADSKLDVNLANSIIPNINEKLANATYYAKALKRKLTRLGADQKSYFQKETRDLKNEYGELLRSIISAIANGSNNPSVKADKLYAYYGKGSPASEDAKKANPTVSLDELSTRIQELMNEL